MSSNFKEIFMKSIFATVLLAMTVLTSSEVFAHGDHGPTQVQPTKGGVIQQAETFFVEVVGSKTEVKIYPLRKDGKSDMLKAIPLAEVKLEATYTLPRAKAATPLTLTKATDHFVGKVAAGSAHRYEVKLKAQIGSDKDELTFQIEPQE